MARQFLFPAVLPDNPFRSPGKTSRPLMEIIKTEIIKTDFRAELRAGRARPEQKLAVCSSGIALSPEDRVELLAVLACDTDASIAERSQNALLGQPLQNFVLGLARGDA